MKNRILQRVGSTFLAAALVGSMMLPIKSYAQGEVVQLQEGTTTQTNTAPELVYLNSYDGANRTENFNDNWKFYLGDAGSAQTPAFDDSGWDRVTLPHDYSIDQDYNRNLDGESGYLPGGTGWYRKSFTLNENLKDKRISIDFGGVYMNATVYVNGEQLGTHPYGYTPFSFDITDHVNFGEENVIAVKVEHKTPSSRFYSGSGIYRDVNLVVTDAVHVDKNGTKVESPDLSAHADGNNVKVTVKTTVVNDSDADTAVTVKHTVFPKGGSAEQAVGTGTSGETAVTKKSNADISAEFTVNGIKLWNLNDPQMYTVKTEVMVGGEVVDTYETDYGFRFFDFNNNTGFSLNGENMKLKGVCMHHDQGALGSVANDRATERQVEILKDMGCNSIRVTHNPASDELIEACNKHGILLIEEAFDGWIAHKNSNSNDYATWFSKSIEAGNEIMGAADGMTWAQFDLTAMIKRGQNDPSIIMWSLGNEMWEGTAGYNNGYRTAQTNLIEWATALDSTRPVTTGDNKLKGREGGALSLAGDLHAADGIVGMNYADSLDHINKGFPSQYDRIHADHPEWRLYGSETASAVNSRGIYKGMGSQTNYGDHDLTSYDTSAVGWGATACSAWYEVIKRDYLAGEYVWTGFDYIGEPTPWNDPYGTVGLTKWPAPKNSYFGIIDTAGLPKDTYYFYQSQWNEDVHTLHILPAWNEEVVMKQGGNVPVVVYSDAAKVQLWFQDAQGGEPQMIGEKEFTTKDTGVHSYQIYEGADKSRAEHENLYLKWMVPYKDGTIFAKAFDASGQEITENLQGRTSVTTAGAPKKLEAKADHTTVKANGQDLSYITVNVTDENGNLVPNADNRVTFKVTGDGVLAGVDNGRPIDHQSYRDNNRKAFSGQVVGIVRSTKAAGTINVEVTAEGLEPQTITITTEAVTDGTAGTKAISSVKMPKNYYVKVGNQPQLPKQLEVTFTDGTTGTANVTWNKVPGDQITTTSSFSVAGTLKAEGVEKTETVYVNVNMIDKVAAILNYSATTSVGVAPKLPESRPAVMADGTVLTASFPVKWNEPADGYNAAGTVVVPGVADVFGQKMDITATVRVQEASYTVGDNIAKEAMKLTQDVPEKFQSDTLEAIRNGERKKSDVSGGKNPSLWSNYDNSDPKKGNDQDAELIFEYATKQNFNQIKVFFREDGWAASYPDAGTTKIYVSDTGESGTWTEVNARETIAPNDNGHPSVKEYTYDFEPTGAVFVKLKVVNNSTRRTNSGFTCTAITEAELYQAKTEDFQTNTTAKLASLSVNGTQAPDASLTAGSWSTAEKTADTVDAKSADNASVTVLPVYEDTVRIVLESEDHKTRNTFVINLDADPTSDKADYAVENITPTAGSASGQNPLGSAFDGDLGTYWHTQWDNTNPAERWVEMELAEPQYVTGLRYHPRPANSGSNGTVKTFKILYKMNAEDEWQEAAVTPGTQEWSSAAEWKLAKLEAPVQAKYVRFEGVETYDDHGGNQFMSAAEIRLKVTDEIPAPTVTDLKIKAMPGKTVYTEGETFDPTGLVLTVEYSDKTTKEVTYGTDEGFTFNPALGTALTVDQNKVTVTYAEHNADILITVKEKVVAESIEVVNGPARMQYTEGETFNPAGLEIKVHYSDGSVSEAIVYGTQNAGEFTFEPSLDTTLTPGTHKATVTYKGMTAELGDITVTSKIPEVTKVEVKGQPSKTEYKAGEKFSPEGLVLTVTYDNGTTKQIAYSAENADQFAFNPSLDTALTEDVQSVKVTFGGQTADIAVTVKSAEPSVPDTSEPDTTTPDTTTPDTTTPDTTTPDSKPDQGTVPSGTDAGESNSAQTGDSFHVALVATIVALSGVAACVMAWFILRKGKKNA